MERLCRITGQTPLMGRIGRGNLWDSDQTFVPLVLYVPCPPHSKAPKLPAFAARLAFERTDDIAGDPAAVVAARLRLNDLAAKGALVHAARIEGEITGDRL